MVVPRELSLSFFVYIIGISFVLWKLEHGDLHRVPQDVLPPELRRASPCFIFTLFVSFFHYFSFTSTEFYILLFFNLIFVLFRASTFLNLLEPSEVMHMAQRWKLDTAKMAPGPRSFQVVSFWTHSVTWNGDSMILHWSSLIFIGCWESIQSQSTSLFFFPTCAIMCHCHCSWLLWRIYSQMVLHMARGGLMVADAHSTLKSNVVRMAALYIVRIAVWMYWMHWNLIRSPLLDIRYRDAAGLFVETCWDQNRRNQQSAVYSHLDSFQMTGGAPTANNVAALRNTAHLSQMCDTGSGYRRG